MPGLLQLVVLRGHEQQFVRRQRVIEDGQRIDPDDATLPELIPWEEFQTGNTVRIDGHQMQTMARDRHLHALALTAAASGQQRGLVSLL